MSTEEKLKEFILSKYSSVREFTLEIDFPYTTLDSILKNDIGNSSVTNVLKICKALHISGDALANGEIVPIQETEKEHVDQDQDRDKLPELTAEEIEIFKKLKDLNLSSEDLADVYRYALFLKEKKA